MSENVTPQSSTNYRHLDFSQEELAAAMRAAYDDLVAFVSTGEFRAVLRELMDLSPQQRPTFVSEVLLNPRELVRRGIYTPKEILVATSAFGDRRPTLFSVRRYLPERFHRVWQNVNLTFDNEYRDEDVTRDLEAVWRRPLPVSLQNDAIARGIDLESISADEAVDGALAAD